MYGFLRTSGISRRAAVFGSITYCLSGYLITWFEYTHRTGTMAWLPAVLWTYELAVKHRDWRYTALSALALGIAILNGQLQFIGAFLILLAFFALGHALGLLGDHSPRRSSLPVAQFAVIAGLGVAIASVLLLPFMGYLSLTRSAFLLPLLIGMLAAHWLNARQTSIVPVMGVSFVAVNVVIGAIVFDVAQMQDKMEIVRPAIITSLILMLMVILFVLLRRYLPAYRPYLDWAFVALLLVDLALWGARYNPVGKAADLYPVTPEIGRLQTIASGARVAPLQTAKSPLFGFNVLPLFGMAEAGGYSSLAPAKLIELVEAGDPKTDASGIGYWLKSNLNMVFFSQPSTRLLDLLQVEYLLSPEPLAVGDATLEFDGLACDAASAEISDDTIVTGAFSVRDTAINRLDLQFRRPAQDAFLGQLLIRMWRLDDAPTLMFEERFGPANLTDGEIVAFYFAPERSAPGHRYEFTVSAVDGVDTNVHLCTAEDGAISFAVAGVDWRETQVEESQVDEFYTYARSAPFPRAYVSYYVEPISTDEQSVSRLLDESFDLRNVVIVDPTDVDPDDMSGLYLERTDDVKIPATQAEIVKYTPNRIIVHASASQPGLLVLAERHHPGWQATVDGAPAEVLPVNYIYRGVLLEPGEHEIVFVFRPRSLQIGVGISFGALLTCIALFIIGFHTKKQQRQVNFP